MTSSLTYDEKTPRVGQTVFRVFETKDKLTRVVPYRILEICAQGQYVVIVNINDDKDFKAVPTNQVHTSAAELAEVWVKELRKQIVELEARINSLRGSAASYTAEVNTEI